jgi:hypothetical protein
MAAIRPITVTRGDASTHLVSTLSVTAADANKVLDALYGGVADGASGGGASGTPGRFIQDSRVYRSFCEGVIGAANTISYFTLLGIEY